MKHRLIYLGDCIKVMKSEIADDTIDLVYADPPYNLSGKTLQWLGNKTGGDWFKMNEHWDNMPSDVYATFTDQWVTECSRVLKDNGSLYVSCTYHNIADVIAAMKKADMKINNVITWYKPNAMPNMTKRVFTHCTEYIVWAVNGSNWIYNYCEVKAINPERQKDGALKQMRDLWTIPLVQGSERLRGEDGRAAHPTQKPEEMLKRIIVASSNKQDFVLDPFVGSGTTAVVAERFDRKWIGIELDKGYVELATNRYQEEFPRDITVIIYETGEERKLTAKKESLFS